MSTVFLAAVSVLLVACVDQEPAKPAADPAKPAPEASPSASPLRSPSDDKKLSAEKADAMAGRWTGTEGASLNVTKKDGKFTIEITTRDGAKSYEGVAKGDAIEFTRNGKTEALKSAAGADTGVKGLEKEKNCVVVTKGSEAYCRQ